MKGIGRKPLIASIIALSMILTGIGYAYWTDTLNVTTKATTGDLDVTFVDLGLYAQYDNEHGTFGNAKWSIIDGIGKGYVDVNFFQRNNSDYNIIAKDGTIPQYYKDAKGFNSIEFDAKLVGAEAIKKNIGDYTIANAKGSDEIELTINNLYPGYAQAFRTDIINVGSIAAKLSNINFELKDAAELTAEAKSLLGVALYMNHDDGSGDVFQLCSKLAVDGTDIFSLGGVNFLRLSALEELSDDAIKAAIENAQIKSVPADNQGLAMNRMDLFIGIAMDPDAEGVYTTGSTKVMAENDDANSQNQSVTLSMNFLWDQFNAGVDAGNGNILVNQN